MKNDYIYIYGEDRCSVYFHFLRESERESEREREREREREMDDYFLLFIYFGSIYVERDNIARLL